MPTRHEHKEEQGHEQESLPHHLQRRTRPAHGGGGNREGAITVSASGFDNSGGQVQAVGDITLNAGSGVINNTASLIRSAGAVSLKAASVINTSTNTATGASAGNANQGVEGNDVAIAAASIANDAGAIRAERDLTLTAGAGVNNNAGLLSAGRALTLQDSAGSSVSGPARALVITNAGGTAIAGQALSITAATLTGDGKLLSRGTLALDLASSFSNTGEITANGNASIAIAGTLTNSGKLLSGATLGVSASTLINTASGEIAGAATQVMATSEIVNRGLIDGQDTRIDAAALHNIGTGRIYGDRLGIAAGTVINDAETVGGATTAGTIAARERLDMGAQTITNREHALIYSGGDMAIGGVLGGALDGGLGAQGRASGSAQSITNSSASIQAQRSLVITARQLLNDNAHYSAAEQASGTRVVIEHAPVGGQRLDASQVRLCDANGCVAGHNLAWLGVDERRQLVLPSAQYPFEALAAYYAAFPASSRDVYDPTCQHADSSCGTPRPGAGTRQATPSGLPLA